MEKVHRSAEESLSKKVCQRRSKGEGPREKGRRSRSVREGLQEKVRRKGPREKVRRRRSIGEGL